jgi:hypothetical protein
VERSVAINVASRCGRYITPFVSCSWWISHLVATDPPPRPFFLLFLIHFLEPILTGVYRVRNNAGNRYRSPYDRRYGQQSTRTRKSHPNFRQSSRNGEYQKDGGMEAVPTPVSVEAHWSCRYYSDRCRTL